MRARGQSIGGVRVWGGWFYVGGLGLPDACGRKRGCLSCREKLGHGSIVCRTPP